MWFTVLNFIRMKKNVHSKRIKVAQISSFTIELAHVVMCLVAMIIAWSDDRDQEINLELVFDLMMWCAKYGSIVFAIN